MVQAPKRDKRPRKGVLNEILCVPGASGQVSAVAVELRSQRFEFRNEVMPRAFDRIRQRALRAFGAHDRETLYSRRRIRPSDAIEPRPAAPCGVEAVVGRRL